MLGIRSLSFAVGFYSPMATTLAYLLRRECVGCWRGCLKAGEKLKKSDVKSRLSLRQRLIAAGHGCLWVSRFNVMEIPGWIPEKSIAGERSLPYE